MNLSPEKIRQIKQAAVELGYEKAAGNGHAMSGLSTTLPAYRTVNLTKASTIKVRPVHWLWQERIALGAVSLIGGREGIGKSLVGYTLAADITRGRLPGVYFGQPRAVAAAATEDTLSFTINGEKVATTPEGDVWTGKLLWTGESDQTIREALQAAAEVAGSNRTVVGEAADWLSDYLTQQGGSADSADVKATGGKAGHTQAALHRARLKLKITTISVGFPRRTHWALQSFHPVVSSPGESGTTTTTTTTATTGVQSSQSLQSLQSLERPGKPATTGPLTADGKPFRFDGRPT